MADLHDFGAVGDGLADATAAFEAAIESIAAGAVLVPPGRYRLTRPVTIRRSGVVLRGAGTKMSVILADPVRGDCSKLSQGRPNSAPYYNATFL